MTSSPFSFLPPSSSPRLKLLPSAPLKNRQGHLWPILSISNYGSDIGFRARFPTHEGSAERKCKGGCWTTFHDTAVRPRIMHHMPPVKQASSLFRPEPGVRNCIAWFSKQEVRKKLLEQGEKTAHVARGRLSRQVTRILASNCCPHFHLIHACHLYLLYTIQ